MLQVDELVLERGGISLFSPVSFKVSPGEIIHLRGRNGIGKTTLLKALLGLWPVTDGKFCWHSRVDVAYVGHSFPLLDCMTVAEHLGYLVRLLALDILTVDMLLDVLGLTIHQHDMVGELSQGQRKLLCIAPIYVQNSTCWLLDEPLTDLDHENQRHLVAQICHRVNKKNNMVILTSHLLEHDFSDGYLRTVELVST